MTCREVAAEIFAGKHGAGRKRKSFAFARFENVPEGSIQLVEEETPSRSVGGERFENPLYRATGSRNGSKLGPGDEPIGLVDLEQAIEIEHAEDIEMDIENL